MNLKAIATNTAITFFILLVAIMSMLIESIVATGGKGFLGGWYLVLLTAICFLIMTIIFSLRYGGEAIAKEAEQTIKNAPTQKEESTLDKDFNNLKRTINNGRRNRK